MTIDSGWVRILKQGRPDAFTNRMPTGVTPSVVFIDGQIKLMKADYIKTWQQFLDYQFERVIQDAFDTGSPIVVLAFDNYEHVPVSKAPTQRRRTSAVPVMTFDPTDDLPRTPPEQWNSAMRNRVFKNKVIALVVRNMAKRFASNPRTLILDWHGVPEVVGKPVMLPEVLTKPDVRRGECDIKAFAYMPMGTLLIFSTDGDFLPLAMVQIERAASAGTLQGDVYVHRMFTKISDVSLRKKRPRLETNRRMYEYVHANKLLQFVQHELPSAPAPATNFATLVAATGCDFAMSLPQLGPVKIWRERARLQSMFELGGDAAAFGTILTIYFFAFQRQHSLSSMPAKGDMEALSAIYTRMVKSLQANDSVSARIKDALWSAERCIAHAQNVNWTLKYWSLLHDCPDPLEQGQYGFEQNKRGAVIFAATN